MGKVISLLNGPNINLLGTREPGVYGTTTLDSIVASVKSRASNAGIEIEAFQSNSEGALVDEIQRVSKIASAIIINPAAYTHTSVAIRDALAASNLPVVEVHLSNIFKREEFRHHSYVSPVAAGIISGFGAQGYLLALDAALALI